VTETGGVLLGRAELERAFTALGERLVRRGVVADVFVVGARRWPWPMTPGRGPGVTWSDDRDLIFTTHRQLPGLGCRELKLPPSPVNCCGTSPNWSRPQPEPLDFQLV
jgi:hypothetical protein